jgi:cobalt-zinc-cadmium efflux system protein
MSHNHSHTQVNRAFLYGIILNSIYIVVEFIYGLSINSMALIADAGHNLSDVLGLVLAWGAATLAARSATAKRTYGFRKSTILAAFFNAIILLIAVGAISIEAIRKFITPAPVHGETMMLVAGIGVIINTLTALLFLKGRKEDLNIKGAFLHMAADAAVSLGVVAAGLVITYTTWVWLDPLISLVIVAVITIGTAGLLREAFNMSMDAVPENIDPVQVRKFLETLPDVRKIHDLHIWAMSTTESALTVHLVMDHHVIDNKFLSRICKDLHDNFGIDHATVQLEHSQSLGSCSHRVV